MADSKSSGAPPEEPGQPGEQVPDTAAWERLDEAIRQALEQEHPFQPPVPPVAAPDGLVPLAQLVDLASKFPKPALALEFEQQIRSGRIAVYDIRRPLDLLSDLYRPVPLEAWAGLVIDWWSGSALPAEHHGPAAAAPPAWKHLHVVAGDVLEPDPHTSGDDLLLTLGTAVIVAILQRWRQVVPEDWLWQLVEYPNLPDPREIAAELCDAIRDGQLRTWTPDGKSLPASAWLGGPGRAALAAGRVNLGALPGMPGSPTQRPRWTAALVRLGDLRGWLGVEREGSAEQESAEAPLLTAGSKSPRGYQADDEPLWQEMGKLIRAGKARSDRDAAMKVQARAKGNSSKARIDRLRKGYRRWAGQLGS